MRSSRLASGHPTTPFGIALGVALAAGLVLASFASEGRSPADPATGGAATPINWPQPLMDKLRGLGWDAPKEDPSKGQPKSKKFEILSIAGGGFTAGVAVPYSSKHCSSHPSSPTNVGKYYAGATGPSRAKRTVWVWTQSALSDPL